MNRSNAGFLDRKVFLLRILRKSDKPIFLLQKDGLICRASNEKFWKKY